MDVKQRPMDEAMVFQRLWDLKARGKLHTREKKKLLCSMSHFLENTLLLSLRPLLSRSIITLLSAEDQSTGVYSNSGQFQQHVGV